MSAYNEDETRTLSLDADHLPKSNISQVVVFMMTMMAREGGICFGVRIAGKANSYLRIGGVRLAGESPLLVMGCRELANGACGAKLATALQSAKKHDQWVQGWLTREKARPTTPCSLLAAGLVFLVVVGSEVCSRLVFGCKW
jgi:hypothetical protein